ncbi:4Fe-4S binding protein [Nocardioides sp. B-3]|uniref:4Fe-4S dicluster domain-containing protein n=1 Tax=Nocardioides sp. B-3 TaxID=2895565 RepID=UPI003FA5DB03
MPYVITQSCCADASCVVACPVNCIHPAPGEPGFAEAEMLYVDADSCVGCGACVTACPVGAIVPDTKLTAAQQPFPALNADYYDTFPHRDRTPIATVPEQRRLRSRGPFPRRRGGGRPGRPLHRRRAAQAPRGRGGRRLRAVADAMHGLVRHGVAPDHASTKRVTELFAAIEEQPGFRYFSGVDVGTDVTPGRPAQPLPRGGPRRGCVVRPPTRHPGRAAARIARGDRRRRLVQRSPRPAWTRRAAQPRARDRRRQRQCRPRRRPDADP